MIANTKIEPPIDEVIRQCNEAVAYLQKQSVLNGNSEMTMDEIDAEIAAARSQPLLTSRRIRRHS